MKHSEWIPHQRGVVLPRVADHDRQVLDAGVRGAERHDGGVRRVFQRHPCAGHLAQGGSGGGGVGQDVGGGHMPAWGVFARGCHQHRGQQPRQLDQRQGGIGARQGCDDVERVGWQLAGGGIGQATQDGRYQQGSIQAQCVNLGGWLRRAAEDGLGACRCHHQDRWLRRQRGELPEPFLGRGLRRQQHQGGRVAEQDPYRPGA